MKFYLLSIALLLTGSFLSLRADPDSNIVCGDINNDYAVDVGDVVFLINNIFKGGVAPLPFTRADVNCDNRVNVGDCVYLINDFFKDGPPPCCLTLNFPPATSIAATTLQINAADSLGPAPGIEFIIQAADTIPGGAPDRPLEYTWRLYGPFDTTATFNYIAIPEDCRYNPQTGEFDCNTFTNVLDTNNLPPPVLDITQPVRRSMGKNFATDPTDVWVSDSAISIYDALGDLDITETSLYKFVIVAGARDASLLPDTTPAQKEIMVIDPRFENGLMVLDETNFSVQNGRYGAGWLDTTKAIMYNYLHNSGYDDFDTSNVDMVSDYFYTTTKSDYFGGIVQSNKPSVKEIFSHSLVVFINEDAGSGPDESSYGMMQHAFALHDIGVPVLLLSNNMGNANANSMSYDTFYKSAAFTDCFGITFVSCEAWFADLVRRDIRNEQFVGAYPNIDSLPHIDVDTQLMNSRYPYIDVLLDSVPLAGVPEVGVAARTGPVQPLYTYISKDGYTSVFHGKVCGQRKFDGTRRSCALNFGPSAIDSTQMQAFFNYILPWLAESFDPAQYPQTIKLDADDIAKRREHLRQYLRQLSQSE